MAKFTYKHLKKARFENNSPNPDPSYANPSDSGFDVRAWIEEGSVTLKPLERKVIHTGLYFEVPELTEIQVRPRSGNALKRGLSICNTPGTIDEGYRGEICVIAINLSNDDITIENGEKIAQCAICPVYKGETVDLIRVDKIDREATDRKEKGFGSTGTA